MSDSSTTSVTMYAFQNDKLLIHKDKDVMIINVSVSYGVVSTNPVRKTSPLICQSFRKEFKYPRSDFLSNEKIVRIISKLIEDLEIQSPLENINWGGNPTPENLAGIISGRLSKIAGACATAENNHRQQSGPCMEFHIKTVEKVSPEKYQQLDDEKRNNKNNNNNHLQVKNPFGDWVSENPKDAEQCIRVLHRLHTECPKENKNFGVRSVTVKEDDNPFFGLCDEEETMCCSICIKELEKGKQAIRMPCSHIFHGLCIFKWISVNPTCPICRSELYRR